MGLFDKFKSNPQVEMTPKLAFTVSMLYMIASDGSFDAEEIGQLLAVIGENNRDVLDAAVKYARSVNIDEFLPEAKNVLSEDERYIILINLLDSSLSNGDAAVEEQELFLKFLDAFEVSEDDFKDCFDVIALKNNKSMFYK